MLCLSSYQRVFYALASWCPRKDKGQLQNAAALYPVYSTQTANFWAQIILDPYRRLLIVTFLLFSKRGLFQDMMFERLHDSTFSEDAPEVIVQPFPYGTFFLNRCLISCLLKNFLHHLFKEFEVYHIFLRLFMIAFI